MELGMGELIVVFLVVLLLFGANKLPQLGEGLGKAIRSFKDNVNDAPSASPPPAEPPAGTLPPAPPPEARRQT